MGIRAGIFLCIICFLLGALFTNWIADSLTLWKPTVTDKSLWIAANYYTILANGPSESFYFLALVTIIGGVTILWSLNDLRAGNIMFDGGSIFLFGTTIIMYLYSALPNIFGKFRTLPVHAINDPFPGSLRLVIIELASRNLICSVALTGILALQAGRFWAESSDSDDEEDPVPEETEPEGTYPQSGKS